MTTEDLLKIRMTLAEICTGKCPAHVPVVVVPVPVPVVVVVLSASVWNNFLLLFVVL